MTTIAYKDGVIAYDSRVTQGRTICDDDYDKHVKSGSWHYFLAGSNSDRNALVQWHQGGKVEAKDYDAAAIITDGKKLYSAGHVQGNEFWCCEERLDAPLSVGSGSSHALTAMDMGADAKTAVKMAAKRDIGTGGRIRTFKVKQ